MRERRIIARTFVAQKRMGGVELMPFKFGLCFIEPLGNFEPALERDMGILSSPNEEDRRLGSPKPLQRVVFSARTKRAGVYIGRIKGDHGAHIRMKTCPNRQMSAQAYAVASDPTRATLVSAKKFHGSVGVLIVGCEFLRVFELIATVGARLIVSQHGSGGLKLVIDLRHRDEIPVAAQGGSHSPDRTGDLKNFRIEYHARMASLPLRNEQVHPHRSA